MDGAGLGQAPLAEEEVGTDLAPGAVAGMAGEEGVDEPEPFVEAARVVVEPEEGSLQGFPEVAGPVHGRLEAAQGAPGHPPSRKAANATPLSKAAL